MTYLHEILAIITENTDFSDCRKEVKNGNKMKRLAFVVQVLALQLVLGDAFVYRYQKPSRDVPQSRDSRLFSSSEASISDTSRDIELQRVLDLARQLGPVGVLKASEEDREKLLRECRKLKPLSDPEPARIPLQGTYHLVYSAHPGPPSGRLGPTPFYGKVAQTFPGKDNVYVNTCKVGPLSIAIRAKWAIKDGETNVVSFNKSMINLFGKTVVQKDIDLSGGEWKYLFLGDIVDVDGTSKKIRIMETPSLFILEKPNDTQD